MSGLTHYEMRLRSRAYTEYNRALREGRLERPDTCSRCGSDGGEQPIHGHHPDYSRPLDVVWLCSTCHGAAHAAMPNRKIHGPTMEPGYIKARDAAAILGISVSALHSRRRKGKVAFVKVGGAIRFSLKYIRKVARDQEAA